MMAVITIAGALICAALGSSTMAQSFSADLLAIAASGEVTGQPGKVQVGSGKIRVEIPELPGDFLISDPAAKTAYLVRPGQHAFMDAKQTWRWAQFLVQVDPTDPCLQWQVMAKIAGAAADGEEWHCVRLADEVLDGHRSFKYRLLSPGGVASTGWIDPKLRFLLRLRGEDGSGIDVRSIEEGPQAESLFAIPPRYVKFDPQQLIERIKQSDVWVEPSK